MLLIHIDAAYKSLEVTTLEISLVVAYLGPLTLGISRAICLAATAVYFATSSVCSVYFIWDPARGLNILGSTGSGLCCCHR